MYRRQVRKVREAQRCKSSKAYQKVQEVQEVWGVQKRKGTKVQRLRNTIDKNGNEVDID